MIAGSSPYCNLNFSPINSSQSNFSARSTQINLTISNGFYSATDTFTVYVSAQPTCELISISDIPNQTLSFGVSDNAASPNEDRDYLNFDIM